MKDVYLFSGIGADERVFQYLNLSGYNPVVIKWIEPHNNESLEEYSFRLLPQIKSHNPVLIGVSFGGMMAIEIARHIQTDKTIIISSVKFRKEIPISFRILGRLGIYLVIPRSILTKPNPVLYKMFGIESEHDKKMLIAILKDTNHIFLKWAMHKIVHWSNTSIPDNIYHIHGENDKIFPVSYIKGCNHIVKHGGHFMIVNKATELSVLLTELLSR